VDVAVDVADSDFASLSATDVNLAVGATDVVIAGPVTEAWAEGQHTNTATVDSSYTDDGGNTFTDSQTDDANYFGADPSVNIVKLFADDSVIAGGAGSSFTLVVTNDGNVDLDGVSITDSVDGRLLVGDVSSGDADCSASSGQNVSCVADLTVGESATITVTFSVDSSTPADEVDNTADASGSYTDDVGNTAAPNDSDTDTVTIETDVNLRLVKDFNSDDVDPDGSGQFTLVVTNDGPSDATGVTVIDEVDPRLKVTGVSTTEGTCSETQLIECTMNLASGETATITVDYKVDIYLDEGADFGTRDGSSFRFEFTNGFVLEGASDKNVTLYDAEGNVVETYRERKKNDFLWSAPNGNDYNLHLSCSVLFDSGLDDEYMIASYSINRYKKGEYFRSCGAVLTPIDVPNTATASTVETGGTASATDSDSVIINEGGFITTPTG
ncbi:MAG: hypothetical protein OES24_19235, partial [Acidimicrobiia bacterium]|nr:hypothetical protein [Acidimicrobiia bacterium]